jgi:hypothetical protein
MTERKGAPTEGRDLMLARLERVAGTLAAGPLGYLAGGRALAVCLASRSRTTERTARDQVWSGTVWAPAPGKESLSSKRA